MLSIFKFLKFKSSIIPNTPFELEHANGEVDIFRENIQDAFLFLKKRKLISGIPLFREKIPLYLMVGESSAGKSSLLLQSDLGLVDAANQPISNPSSTRYCRFWFSDKAIFVDIAGNYMTSGHEDISVNLAWRGLVKLLNSYKSCLNLSRLFVVIDLPSLSRDENERNKVLTDIKHRIYEISRYVKELPMFLVFTKSDLINGFNEFFNDLSDEERKQSFGIDFTNDTIKKILPIQTFDSKFTTLLEHMNTRMFERLHIEQNLESRCKIKDFPLQMESLRPVISEIINEIPSNEMTRLYGVYFTSSLQKGAAIDCLSFSFVSGEEKKANGVKNSKSKYKLTSAQKRPYFVNNLFCDKEKRIKKKHNFLTSFDFRECSFVALIAVFCLGIFGLFFYYNYAESKSTIKDLNIALQQYKKFISSQRQDFVEAILPLERIKHDCDYKFWQIFKTKKLNDFCTVANKDYSQALSIRFAADFVGKLESVLVSQEKADAFDLYSSLKTYLMLSGVEKSDNNYIKNWFFSHSKGNLDNNIETEKYLVSSLSKGLLKITPDKQVIEIAKVRLLYLPKEELVYAILRSESDLNNQLMDFGGNVLFNSTFNNKKLGISNFYNPSYVNKIYLEIPKFVEGIAVSPAKKDDVLLKQFKFSKYDIVRLSKKVQDLYLKDYFDMWNVEFRNIKVNKFSNSKQAYEKITVLTKKDSPLFALLNIVKAGADIKAANNKLGVKHRNNFVTLDTLDAKALEGAIANFASYFNFVNAKDYSDKDAFERAKSIMQTNRLPKEFELLIFYANKQPLVLKNLLLSLVDNGFDVLLQDSDRYLNLVWSSEVIPKYVQKIESRYPFFKNAKDDVSLRDFADFFGANGSVILFFNNYLKPFVNTKHAYWTWKNLYGHTINIPQSSLEMFIRADLIRKMFFASPSQSLQFGKFSFMPMEISKGTRNFTMVLGGQVIFVSPDKMKNYNLKWPHGKSGKVDVEFVDQFGKAFNMSFDGDWALFRFLDKSHLQATNDPKRYSASFGLNGNSVEFALVADKPINPFIGEVIDNFRCADKL